MNGTLIRKAVIVLAALMVAYFAKMEAINFMVAMGAGIWVMVRLFDLFFGTMENLDFDVFIPHHPMLFGFLQKGTRKQAFLALIWWLSGIASAIATYKLLKALFISP